MEHLIQDVIDAQLIWAGLLVLTIFILHIIRFDSINVRYQMIRGAFLSFPVILMIKLFHLELPIALFAEEEIPLMVMEKIPVQSYDWLTITFLSLFVILALVKIFQWIVSSRIKANTSLIKDETLNVIFNSIREEMNLKREIIFLKSDARIKSPYCYGFLKYHVIIPESLMNETEKSLRTILIHELNHIRRKDTVSLFFEELIHFVALVNPMSYITRYYLNDEREKRCDQDVIDSKWVDFKDYATTLLDIKLKTQHGYWPIPVAQLTTQSTNLERRIKSMKKLRKKDSKIKISITSILLILTMIIVACENKSEEPAEETEVAFGEMTKEQLKDYKEKQAAEFGKERKPIFELKDGTKAAAFGDMRIIEKGKDYFVVRDPDGKEHHVKVDRSANGDVQLEAPELLLKKMKEFKAQAAEKNEFTLRELKSEKTIESKLQKVDKNDFHFGSEAEKKERLQKELKQIKEKPSKIIKKDD